MKTFPDLWFAVALGLAILPPAHAEMMLVPAVVSVAPVSEVTVDVLITNSASAPLPARLEPRLTGRLHAGSARSADVILIARDESGERQVPPGGFARVRYTFQLPVGFLGPVVLEIPGLAVQPVMFSAQALDIARRASAPVAAKDGPADGQMMHETALRRGTRIIPGVTGYEPVYLGLGAGGGFNAKFQLSFKYQPADIWPFYLSYTQTSVWDLHSTSKPFKDTAYRPRAFFLKEESWVSADNKLRLGLEGGAGHESNGRGNPGSRSINIAYVRP